MSEERFWISMAFIAAVLIGSITYMSLQYALVENERLYSNRRHAIEKGCLFLDGRYEDHVICGLGKPVK